MSTPTIEHRVDALGRRVTRAEEDVAAIISAVADIRREQVRQAFLLDAMAAQMGVTAPTPEQVDAALDDQS